jgi:hypothetical protein
MRIKVNLKDRQAYLLYGYGKTYLYKLLNSYSSVNNDVLAFTYREGQTEIDILKRIKAFKGQLVMFDRFDMYFNKAAVNQCIEQGCTIIMDLKSDNLANSVKVQVSNFKVDKDTITIEEW